MLGLQIRFMRFFWGSKKPQPNRLVVNFDFSQPFFIFPSYASKPASIGYAHFLGVLRVLSVGRFSKVFQTVIRSISVYMVNLLFRPFVVTVKPRQTMRVKQFIIQTDNNVTVSHFASGFIAKAAFASGHRPSKKARIWVVIDQLFKPVLANRVSIHTPYNITNKGVCQV